MHPHFAAHLKQIVELFDKLEACEPLAMSDKLPNTPAVYTFSSEGHVERVGRTNKLRNRIKAHTTAKHTHAAFAFKRAKRRIIIDNLPYAETRRKVIWARSDFKEAFFEEIEKIKRMKLKYVIFEDMTNQYLLELYASIHHDLSLEEFGNPLG